MYWYVMIGEGFCHCFCRYSLLIKILFPFDRKVVVKKVSPPLQKGSSQKKDFSPFAKGNRRKKRTSPPLQKGVAIHAVYGGGIYKDLDALKKTYVCLKEACPHENEDPPSARRRARPPPFSKGG